MQQPNIPLANDQGTSFQYSPSKRAAKREKVSLPTLVASIAITILFIIFHLEERSPLFIASSTVLTLANIFFVIAYKPTQILSPLKISSILYTCSFAYAPLWLASNSNNYASSYYGNDVEGLMGSTAFMTLVSYILMIGGYFVALFFSKRASNTQIISINKAQARYAIICGLVTGAIGGFCYLILLIKSGGLGHLLSYSGGRADIFGGVYGAWFWGMHFLFATYGLFAIVNIRKHPWLCLCAALILALAFFPLQGRDIVVAPLFCWLIFFNFFRKRISWRAIMLGGIAILVISAMLGAFRAGGNQIASKSVGNFFERFIDDSKQHLMDVVALNIEQLDSAMIAVRYVEKEQQTIGPFVLTDWFKPIDRLILGDIVPSIMSGVFMDLLVTPEHRGWSTALSPSLPGELYIGMGWFGIGLGMFIYGIGLGSLENWASSAYKNPVLFAAYPFVLYIVTKMIVDGTLHIFRFLIVLLAVYALALFASKKKIKAIKSN